MFEKLKEDLKNIKRFKEIVNVFAKHSFLFFIKKFKIHTFLSLSDRLEYTSSKAVPAPISPKKLRFALEDLGGAFSKLGQFLSIRPDLIPRNFCEELEKMQDKNPPIAFSIIEKKIRNNLGDSVKIQHIEERPHAVGTIAQLHKAVIDGDNVIIKVKKPGVDEKFQTDINIVNFLARHIEKYFKSDILDLQEIAKEFENYTKKELNFVIEVENIKKFHENFKSVKNVIIPKVYDKVVTQDCFYMQYVPGRKITDYHFLDINSRKQVSNIAANMIYKQIFIDGFFHADPHPGNILIKRLKGVEYITLLDFGIVGKLSTSLRQKLTAMFIALILKNLDALARSLLALNMVDTAISKEVLIEDLSDALSEYYNVELKDINFAEVFYKAISVAKKDKIRLPANLVLLGKAIVTMQGFATKVDPSFNLVQSATPFCKKILGKTYSFNAIIREFTQTSKNFKDFFVELPQSGKEFLQQLRSISKKADVIDKDIHMVTRELDRSSNRVTYALIIVGLLITAALTINVDTTKIYGISILSFVMFCLVLILLIMVIVSIAKEEY